MEVTGASVRLTQLSHGGGCACKVRQGDLAEVMRRLPVPFDPRVLVGLDPPDDAAVIALTDETALVFTTDFFTPIVDHPHTFGRIAATNALSDVYAMGAAPLVALAITAFPSRTLPLSVLSDILAGGMAAARAAGIVVAGGHTIDDAEPKYGLAVIGTVDPRKLWRKGGARPGDALVLTKALGTGIISTALKRGKLTEDHPTAQSAIASMLTLNASAVTVARNLGITVHAATDVTGFGLVGHLREMLKGTVGVGATLVASSLPELPGALALASEGMIAGGTRSNREFAGDMFAVGERVDEVRAWLACDAQTSGGLLFAIPADESEAFVAALRAEAGLPSATVIGHVGARETASVNLV